MDWIDGDASTIERSPATAAEAVTKEIRSMIMSGSLKPSERLREADLAHRLNVSRTPVRVALGNLEREGLLTYLPNRGFTVRPFDLSDFEQAYAVRAELEAMAARVAAERGLDRSRYEDMQNCIDAVDRMLENHDELNDDLRLEWRGHNARFHRVLHEAIGNRYLIESLALLQRIPLVHHALMLYYDRDRLVVYNDQHREILRAIGSRQGTRASHLMWEHVSSNRQAISDKLGVFASG